MLFAFTVATEHVVIVVLAALAAALLVALLCRKNPEWVKHKQDMHDVSSLLEKEGFPHLAKVFAALAFGDLVGAIKEGKYLLRQMKDPKTAAVLLSESFFLQLGKRLADGADRSAILKAVNDWIAANPEKVQVAKDATTGAAVVGATVAATAVKAAVV